MNAGFCGGRKTRRKTLEARERINNPGHSDERRALTPLRRRGSKDER
jgi:hypothetical protein